MPREIRKVRDLGNGSGGVTIPKDTLRDWGFVNENGELAAGHIAVSDDGDVVTIEPIQ